jgi:hypothetical protein
MSPVHARHVANIARTANTTSWKQQSSGTSTTAPVTNPLSRLETPGLLEPLRHVQTDSLDVAYLEAGPAEGPVAVLLHGFPVNEPGRSNMNRLQGKTAMVTGGTTGIGLAAAQRFAAEGAHVFVAGRRRDALGKGCRLHRRQRNRDQR